MALSKAGLKQRILTELDNLGFDTSHEKSWMPRLAEGMANAVVDEIQANAAATGNDSGGDSHNLGIE